MEGNIEKFIEFVVDLATEVYYDEYYISGKALFTGGGYFIFPEIIRNYFDIEDLLIRNTGDHWAFSYKGEYYNANGLITDKENYKIADEEDILYMRERFGGHIVHLKVYETMMYELNIIDNLPYLPSKTK